MKAKMCNETNIRTIDKHNITSLLAYENVPTSAASLVENIHPSIHAGHKRSVVQLVSIANLKFEIKKLKGYLHCEYEDTRLLKTEMMGWREASVAIIKA
jgi:hypothetical protein